MGIEVGTEDGRFVAVSQVGWLLTGTRVGTVVGTDVGTPLGTIVGVEEG